MFSGSLCLRATWDNIAFGLISVIDIYDVALEKIATQSIFVCFSAYVSMNHYFCLP